jgi:membrane fusion protein (multidrug efflux system)
LIRKHFFLVAALAALLAMIVAGALMLVVSGAAKANKAKGAGAGGRAVAVAQTLVKSYDFTDRIEALGVAKARQSVTVTSNTAELITKVLFSDGQKVAKGQVLVELKGDEQDAAVLQAQAVAAQAHRDAARWRELATKGYAPRATAEQYQATSAQADALLSAAKSRRLNRVIRAPFSGVVGLSDVAPGALIAAGGPIVSLDDTAVIRIDFPVPDRFLPRLRKGLVLKASVDAYPSVQFSGRIAEIDTRIDERTRSVRVRAEFANADGRLLPGMLARVALEQGVRPALAVPEAAIQFEGEQAYVFLIAAKGEKTVASRQVVEAGIRQNGMVEIRKGLSAGAKIVADGLNRIQPDQAIKIGKDRRPGAGGPRAADKASRGPAK